MSSKAITLFEYDPFEIEKSETPLTTPDIENIKRLNDSIRRRYKTKVDLIKLEPDGYKPTHLTATNFVGVVKAGRKTIQILPKTAGWDGGQDAKERSIKNLLQMLSFTKKLGVREIDLASLRRVKDDFFEVLIFLLAKNLLELLKHEMHKEYVDIEDNLSYVKGRIQFAEHIRRNYVVKNKFFVAYDEFLEDNLLNQILKYTAHLLKRQSTDSLNKRMLQECSFLLGDITLKPIHLSHFKKVHLSRLNENYEPILNLCKLFIGQSSVELRPDKAETFSFIFDMNKLFEEFIGEFIRRYFSYKYSIRVQQSSKHLIESVKKWEEPSKPTPAYALTPDIAFYRAGENKPCLLLDTKYKELKPLDNAQRSEKRYGVSTDDMYQMCAYSLKYECPDVIILYPQKGLEAQRFTLCVNEHTKVHIRTVDISRDLRGAEGKRDLEKELKRALKVPAC